MSETTALTIAIAVLGVTFGCLMTVIGWIGNKLYNKVDEMAKAITSMSSELHTRITGIDTRLTRVEAVESMCLQNPMRRSSDKEGD